MQLASITALILILLCTPSFASTLLDFNEGGDGTSWTNWTYYGVGDTNRPHGGSSIVDGNGADGYGSAGFVKNDAQYYFIGRWAPRVNGKNDYTDNGGSNGCAVGATLANDVVLDALDKAPNTASGASLKFGQNASSTCNDANAWFKFPDNFSNMGLATSDTDRLNFYAKFQMAGPNIYTAGNVSSDNVHVGVYLCETGDCYAQSGDGESGVLNDQGHFYHYLKVNPGAWIHVQLDRHPSHERGQSGLAEPTDNAIAGGYYALMNSFYIEARYPQLEPDPVFIWADEFTLDVTTQQENDISITSAWVGYWPTSNYWEMSWADMSFRHESGYSAATQSTFEVRYSTAPITNVNFESATLIVPQYNAYNTNKVRRPNTWTALAWTRFALPAEIQSGNKVYFAVKDVSAIGNGDGHNSPSASVHTIDYGLSPNYTPPTTTPSRAPGRYAATQQLALTATAGTTKYCFGAGCTPTATYSAPFKVLQNLARQTLRYQSTDGAGVETVKEAVFLKQRRR